MGDTYVEDGIDIWLAGNTGLRNPNRIQSWFRLISHPENAIVKMADYAPKAHIRRWRSNERDGEKAAGRH